jgi:hypothetical protein
MDKNGGNMDSPNDKNTKDKASNSKPNLPNGGS